MSLALYLSFDASDTPPVPIRVGLGFGKRSAFLLLTSDDVALPVSVTADAAVLRLLAQDAAPHVTQSEVGLVFTLKAVDNLQSTIVVADNLTSTIKVK